MRDESGQWRRIQELFDGYFEVPPEDRSRWLAEQSGGDAALQGEVLRLVAADARESRIDRPLAITDIDAESVGSADAVEGRSVGRYRLIRRIAEGGMGMVYEAVRADGEYEQRVAVKVIRVGIGSETVVRRFVQEGRILARLEHSGIARFLDGGVSDDGYPFLAMEYVDGLPVDLYCRERCLTIRERIELFCVVCEAISYAHRKLVVHRDIKPSNVLVDAQGQIKLLDFGIAKLLGTAEDAHPSTLTSAGIAAMTPAYASPEQLQGEPISTASDVFSLGVVLYELLSGLHPFRAEKAGGAPLSRSWRPETRVPLPSAVVTDAAARERGETSAAQLRRRLAGDLDNIVLACLRSEPELRYAGADHLADELHRHLAGLPVRARGDSAGYRLRKFVRRNRGGVAAAALVGLSLIGGVATTTWQAQRAQAEAHTAEVERARAERVRDFLRTMLAATDASWNAAIGSGGPDVTVAEVLDGAAANVGTELANLPELEAEVRRTLGSSYRALGLYPRAVEQLELALALDQQHHDGPHRDVALDLNELGVAHYLAGDLQRAEEAVRLSLAEFEAAAADSDSLFITTLSILATINVGTGDLLEAETLMLRSQELGLERWGETHPVVAINYNNLGTLYAFQGRLDEAERYYRLHAAIFDRMAPREYMEQGVTLANIARLRIMQGDYAEADHFVQRAMGVVERTIGLDQHRAVQPMFVLALLRFRQGRYAEAEAEVQRALAVLADFVPEDHLDVATAQTVYGRILTATGRAEEAEQRLRSALELRSNALPEGNWRIGETAGALGLTLLARDRPTEAEPLLRASYDSFRGAFGDSDPRTGAAAGHLADFYQQSGETSRAAQYRRLADPSTSSPSGS